MRDRQARIDTRESPDRMEAKLANEPTENAEPKAPIDPIDKIEPADPIDRIDPADPIDRIDPLEPMLRIDPAEPLETPLFAIDLLSQCSLREPAPAARPG